MKKLVLLFAVIALLFSSCVTRRACERKFPGSETTNTITIIETVYRDTIVFVQIPADTVYKDMIVYVDNETGLSNSEKSTLETQYAKSWAQVVGGRLLHQLEQKDAKIEALIKDAIRENSTTTETIKEVVKYTNRLAWWQSGLVLWGVFSLFVFAFFVYRSLRG